MSDEQKRTIWLIARWLNESVDCGNLDRFDDYLASYERAPHYDIAEELRHALGYPTAEGGAP